MIKIPAFLAALVLIACPLAIAAQDQEPAPWYDIEIIIFEYKAKIGDAEVWPQAPGRPDYTRAIELVRPGQETTFPAQTIQMGPFGAAVDDGAPADPDSQPLPEGNRIPFQLLEKQEFRLQGINNRLQQTSEYVPLMHVAWRQPIAATQAPGARLHSGMSGQNLDREPDRGQESSSGQPLSLPPRIGETFDLSKERQVLEDIDGVITLRRNRFIHVDIDLLVRNPETGARQTGLFSLFSRKDQGPELFRIQHNRRVRVGEANYFDHPLFGIIVQVTPYDPADRPQS